MSPSKIAEECGLIRPFFIHALVWARYGLLLSVIMLSSFSISRTVIVPGELWWVSSANSPYTYNQQHPILRSNMLHHRYKDRHLITWPWATGFTLPAKEGENRFFFVHGSKWLPLVIRDKPCFAFVVSQFNFFVGKCLYINKTKLYEHRNVLSWSLGLPLRLCSYIYMICSLF